MREGECVAVAGRSRGSSGSVGLIHDSLEDIVGKSCRIYESISIRLVLVII